MIGCRTSAGVVLIDQARFSYPRDERRQGRRARVPCRPAHAARGLAVADPLSSAAQALMALAVVIRTRRTAPITGHAPKEPVANDEFAVKRSLDVRMLFAHPGESMHRHAPRHVVPPD
jgi:hypothetical protein